MNIFNLFKKESKKEISDLAPRGIAKSIIPVGHGTREQYNEAWTNIYSQRRNLDIIVK